MCLRFSVSPSKQPKLNKKRHFPQPMYIAFLQNIFPQIFRIYKLHKWHCSILVVSSGRYSFQVVLCALHAPCIAPTLHRGCRFYPQDRFNYYAKCHRFDQSAFAILMLNHFNLSASSYYAKKRTVKIERFVKKEYEIQECYPES